MPVVLVHGVPETAALWDDLRAGLRWEDTVALALPGFGTPRPDGFDATKESYVRWLVGALEDIGEPVDLVGHDWGGAFVVRLVATRPDLVRSWVSDALYLFDPRYRWHRYAVTWQTPAEGERDVAATLAGDPDDRAEAYVHWGVPRGAARRLASWFDARMGAAILDLYRSGTDVSREWSRGLELCRPGLVLLPERDPFAVPDLARAVAKRQDGVELVPLEGLGHWWMLQDPTRTGAVLQSFWDHTG